MDERIKELAEEATRKYDRLGGEIPFAQPDLEIFAALIIENFIKESGLMKFEDSPVAWLITKELQDGTQETVPLTGRFKDVKDACDFGEPIPLYVLPEPLKPPTA